MKRISITTASIMLIAFVSSLTLFVACKKNSTYTPGSANQFENSQTAIASINGQVIDENGLPLKDVNVRVGTHVYVTNQDGIFYFNNISTPVRATLITVSKDQYLDAYRTISITMNQSNSVRIMMIEKKNPSTFNSITGGTIQVNGGGSVQFPANSLVYKNNGTSFNGTATVYTKFIDPTAKNLPMIMPGDLRAIDANNDEKVLASFGMMAVELYDANGEALQLAPSKTAQLTFPIPSTLMSKAPNTIPLWYFDIITGMWREEGKAQKNGSNYVGDVKHFTFWNCDLPGPYVNFSATFKDPSGTAYTNVMINITDPTTSGHAAGFTNGVGFVSGNIPANATLTLEVFDNYPCYTLLYTQTITTTTSNLNLGVVTITPPTTSSTITGTVLDCSGNPVNNGLVTIVSGYQSFMVQTNSVGVYNNIINFCSYPANITLTAYDMTSLQNASSTAVINAGANNLGTIQACGASNPYIHWTSTVGGATSTFDLTAPTDALIFDYSSNMSNAGGWGTPGSIYFLFDGVDNTSGIHNLVSFSDHLDSMNTITTTIPVNLSMYQPMGGYVQGNFSGSVTGGLLGTRTITCDFLLKRN